MTGASVRIMVGLTSPWTPGLLEVRVSAPNVSTSVSAAVPNELYENTGHAGNLIDIISAR